MYTTSKFFKKQLIATIIDIALIYLKKCKQLFTVCYLSLLPLTCLTTLFVPIVLQLKFLPHVNY